MKHLDALISEGKFHYNGDPVLAWMFSNVVAHFDIKDNVFPRKERDENKIDGIVALLMCAWERAMVADSEPGSIYERGGRYSYEGSWREILGWAGAANREYRSRVDLSAADSGLHRLLPDLRSGKEPLMGLLTKAFERRSNLSNPDPWLVSLMGGPTTAAGMRVIQTRPCGSRPFTAP